MYSTGIPVWETSVGFVVDMSLCVAWLYFFFPVTYSSSFLSPPPHTHSRQHPTLFCSWYTQCDLSLSLALSLCFSHSLSLSFSHTRSQSLSFTRTKISWIGFGFRDPLLKPSRPSLFAIEKNRQRKSNWDETEFYLLVVVLLLLSTQLLHEPLFVWFKEGWEAPDARFLWEITSN